MTAVDALSRMIRLVRDFVPDHVSDDVVVGAFQNCVVRCIADAHVMASSAGQSGVIGFASLVARMGVQVELDVPDVSLVGHQPPLRGRDFVTALCDLGADLIPGTWIAPVSVKPDLAFVFGRSVNHHLMVPTWYVSASDWGGVIDVNPPSGSRRPDAIRLPIGSLTAAALAAAEVFKYVVGQLPLIDPYYSRFLALAERADWDFGRVEVPERLDLGELTIVSAGAIMQSALFALFRFREVHATGDVYDDDHVAVSNLNRNPLDRRGDVGEAKVSAVVAHSPTHVRLRPVQTRFSGAVHHSAGRIIVGVDDIPARWDVQRTHPEWLGVAGTTHFGVSCSSHTASEPCAGCLHTRDDRNQDPIPTVSFVSFWAGLSLAVYLVRHVVGHPYGNERQQLWLWPLRVGATTPTWLPVAAHKYCPVGCDRSSALHNTAA